MPKLVSGNFIEGRLESWHNESDVRAWVAEMQHTMKSRNSKCAFIPSPKQIELACVALREQADFEYEEWWNSIPLENLSKAEESRLKRGRHRIR